MRRHTIPMLLSCAILAALGCTTTSASCDLALPVATVATFNAGLARNFVGLAAERVEPVAQAVAGLQADLVCLQEVWEDDDVARILAATKGAYPHSYWEKTVEELAVGTPAACTPGDAGPMKACVEAHCATAPSLSDCALAECKSEYLGSSASCKTCLAANIYLNSIPGIFAACADSSATKFAGGRNGLLLLSKTPFAFKEFRKLDSFLIQRVVLHVQVTLASRPTDVYCTHLQAGLGDIAYTGAAGSWQAEQKAQLQALTAFVDETEGNPSLVMGDMNCGPSLVPGIDAELPENFQIITDWLGADWKTWIPFVSTTSPVCSWCADNRLTGPTKDLIIDHILLRGGWESMQTARIMDAPITVQLPTGTTETNLSDHYGISAQLTYPVFCH